jgi:hypothetical protein
MVVAHHLQDVRLGSVQLLEKALFGFLVARVLLDLSLQVLSLLHLSFDLSLDLLNLLISLLALFLYPPVHLFGFRGMLMHLLLNSI